MKRKIFGVCILLVILTLIFIACSKSSHENKVTTPTGDGGVLSTAISESPNDDVFEETSTSPPSP